MRRVIVLGLSMGLIGCGSATESVKKSPDATPAKAASTPADPVSAPTKPASKAAEPVPVAANGAVEGNEKIGKPPIEPNAPVASAKAVHKAERVLPVFKHDGDGFGVSADGKRIAFAGTDFKDAFDKDVVRVVDVETANVLHEFPVKSAGVVPVALSADGRRVAFIGLSAVVADAATGESTVDLDRGDKPRLNGHQLEFSRDGKSLWGFTSNDVVEFDSATGTEKRAFTWGDQFVDCFALFPDGSHVAAGFRNAGVVIWNLANGDLRILDPGSATDRLDAKRKPLTFAATPDGKKLVVSRFDEGVELWDLTTGKSVHSYRTHASRNDAAVFLGAGKTLLTQGAWLTPSGDTDDARDGYPLHVIDIAALRVPMSAPLVFVSRRVSRRLRGGRGS